MLRTEEAFFATFLGVLLAGGVPVPVYPPFRRDLIEDYAQRQVGILENAGARAIITFPEAMRVATLLRSRVRSVRHIVTADDLARAELTALSPAGPDEPALIQNPSGSTGAPKGVLLSPAHLLALLLLQHLALYPYHNPSESTQITRVKPALPPSEQACRAQPAESRPALVAL